MTKIARILAREILARITIDAEQHGLAHLDDADLVGRHQPLGPGRSVGVAEGRDGRAPGGAGGAGGVGAVSENLFFCCFSLAS